MSTESPTLKVRFKLNGYGFLGSDCHQVADKIANAYAKEHGKDISAIDAKWGREPLDWAGPGDWGRLTLSDREKGYVDAVRTYDPQSPLLAIIDRIVKR